MKILKIIILSLIPILLSSQSNDIEIIEEQIDNNTQLNAQNNTEDNIQLTLELTSTGFRLRKNRTFKVNLGPKETKEIVLLKPKPNSNYSYSYKVKYKVSQTVTLESSAPVVAEADNSPQESKEATSKSVEKKVSNKTSNNLDIDNSIIVFSKSNCGRCTRTIEYLKTNNIKFTEKSITKSKKNRKELNNHLFESGFKGGSFSTPVIVVDGKVNYNIEKLDTFLSKLKN